MIEISLINNLAKKYGISQLKEDFSNIDSLITEVQAQLNISQQNRMRHKQGNKNLGISKNKEFVNSFIEIEKGLNTVLRELFNLKNCTSKN